MLLTAKKSAVPPVAINLKPSCRRARAGARPASLSLSASETNTEPVFGRGPNAEI